MGYVNVHVREESKNERMKGKERKSGGMRI